MINLIVVFNRFEIGSLNPLESHKFFKKIEPNPTNGSPNIGAIQEIGIVPVLDVNTLSFTVLNSKRVSGKGVEQIVISSYVYEVIYVKILYQLLIILVNISERILVQVEYIAV